MKNRYLLLVVVVLLIAACQPKVSEEEIQIAIEQTVAAELDGSANANPPSVDVTANTIIAEDDAVKSSVIVTTSTIAAPPTATVELPTTSPSPETTETLLAEESPASSQVISEKNLRQIRQIGILGSEDIQRNISTGIRARSHPSFENGIHDFDVSSDDNFIAVAAGDSITLWQTIDLTLLKEFNTHYGEAAEIRFTPNGNSIVTRSTDGVLRIRDTVDGSLIQIFEAEDTFQVEAFLITPDEPTKIIYANDVGETTLHIRKIDGGEPVGTIDPVKGSSANMALSPDANILAITNFNNGRRGQIYLYDIETLDLINVLETPLGEGNIVTFSPDGTLLATTRDRAINIVDISGISPVVSIGAGNHVNSFTFSPDGSLLIAFTESGELQFWDTQTGSLVYAFHAHIGYPRRVRIAQTGKLLITTDSSSLYFWAVAGEEEPELVTELDEEEISSTVSGEAAGSVSESGPVLSRNLSLTDPRMRGEEVKLAQQHLFDLGYTQVGEIDGVFGPITESAVKDFQADQGIEADGIVGPITWERLFQNPLDNIKDAAITSQATLAGDGLVRLTFGDNRYYTPDVSKDQDTMIASAEIGDYWRLVSFDPNGSGEINQITSQPADFHHPQFSADKEQILVSSDLEGDLDIYLIDATTGEIAQHLIDSPGDDIYPVWLPDNGGFIFTSSRDGNEEVYLAGLDGSTPRRLTNSLGFDGFADVSPDGRTVAIQSNRDNNYDIYLLDLDTEGLIRLTTDHGRDASPSFSPDGEWIAFESDRSGNYEIYAIKPDGLGLHNVTNHPYGDWFPMFSPDGEWLIFQSNRESPMDIYRQPWRPGT